jgi:hypothetical protein
MVMAKHSLYDNDAFQSSYIERPAYEADQEAEVRLGLHGRIGARRGWTEGNGGWLMCPGRLQDHFNPYIVARYEGGRCTAKSI